MKIIVGLGNPGKEYEKTKHNLGFMFLDYLNEKLNLGKFKKFKSSEILESSINGEKVIFAKPQTFMNLSGKSVIGFLDFYKIPLEDMIVIYDDMDIEKSKIRIRKSGSPGSHNGMKSIVNILVNEKFPRIRVGIGKPEHEHDIINYVIGAIDEEDKIELEKGKELAKNAVIEILKNGIDNAMNKYN